MHPDNSRIIQTQQKFNQVLLDFSKNNGIKRVKRDIFKYSLIYSSVLLSMNAFASSQITPSGEVENANTAMFSVDDIYHRLNDGTSGNKRTTVFTEPSSGPGSSGYDLNDVMSLAPVVDNTNGATAAEVVKGKTFWGLRDDGTWGTKIGTRHPGLVMKTGQTECYSTKGTIENPCVSLGQDGDYEKGESVSTRFTDNADGTVTDNLTGLTWLKDASCSDLALDASGNFVGSVDSSGNIDSSGNRGYGNWKYALAISNTLKNGVCGLTDGSSVGDWRLPNVKEIRSLIDYGNNSPALPTGHPFTDVKFDRYWTSTTSPFLKHYAIASNFFYDASGSILQKEGFYGGAYAWPVK